MKYRIVEAEKDAELIASLGCLASILEVYGYPKPGNVHRFADYEEKTMLHFLTASVALFPPLTKAARTGNLIQNAKIPPSEAKIGARILECVKSKTRWGVEQNTNLGVVLLLVPLVIAAGASQRIENNSFVSDLRLRLRQILESSKSEDVISVGRAIALANPSGLGTSTELDVSSKSFESEVSERNVTLVDLFEPAKTHDLIAREYVTGFQITFEISNPFISQMEERFCLEKRTVLLFLHLMTSYLDSHIVRNQGVSVAEEIQKEIKTLGTPECLLKDSEQLWQFDERLRQRKLNPGTTADLTAAGLFVNLLDQIQRPNFEGFDFCLPF